MRDVAADGAREAKALRTEVGLFEGQDVEMVVLLSSSEDECEIASPHSVDDDSSTDLEDLDDELPDDFIKTNPKIVRSLMDPSRTRRQLLFLSEGKLISTGFIDRKRQSRLVGSPSASKTSSGSSQPPPSTNAHRAYSDDINSVPPTKPVRPKIGTKTKSKPAGTSARTREESIGQSPADRDPSGSNTRASAAYFPANLREDEDEDEVVTKRPSKRVKQNGRAAGARR